MDNKQFSILIGVGCVCTLVVLVVGSCVKHIVSTVLKAD